MWEDVLLYVIIGFVAQMIDGAIGMAYGVTSCSVLLGLGVPPATASACVHAAEPQNSRSNTKACVSRTSKPGAA